MDERTLGLTLLWLGVLLLVGVLAQRVRKGAWGEDAFEQAPKVPAWTAALAAIGLGLAFVGGGVAIWSLR